MTGSAKPGRLPTLDTAIASPRAVRAANDQISAEQHALVLAERDLYKRLIDLGNVVDPQPFIEEALALVVEVAGAKQGYLELYDNDTLERAWCTSFGFSDSQLENVRTTISRGIIAKAVASGEMLVTPSAMLDPRFSEFDSVQVGHIEAVLCTPIGHDPVRGVLYLQGREHPGLYNEGERKSAEMFAAQLAPLVNLLLKAHPETQPTLLAELRNRLDIDGVVGKSAALVQVLSQLPTIAPLDVGVLITGETGTGKTQLAQLMHRNSARKDGPFVELNCGLIQETLVESELFGTVAGAFTGATDRAGKVEAADGGTLLLDDIGDLPQPSQVKLLQLLQSRQFTRVGSTEVRKADFRLIAATNVDLKKAIDEGRFREDLYFRLEVLQIRMPSLSERQEDIRSLLTTFCELASARNRLPLKKLSTGAICAAETAEWPGNIRQLANTAQAAVIRAAAQSAQQIERCHLFPDLEDCAEDATQITFQEATRRFQAGFLRDSLEEHDWNIAATARALDLARSHVYNLIKAYDLHRKR